MPKIKFNEDKQTFTIKGLTHPQVEALYTLIWHTQLGEGLYSHAAFQLANMFDTSNLPISLAPEDCQLGVRFEEDSPLICLTHYNDKC